MAYMKNVKNTLMAILLTGLLSCLCSCTYASEQVASETKNYTITEQQLAELETKLNLLEINNERLAKDCNELKLQLQTSQTALTEGRRESERLRQQLKELKTESESNEDLLAIANESLEKLELERQRIERQRKIAYTVAACALFAALKN